MAIFEANKNNYDEQLNAAEYVMVDYYGEHCGACVYTEPYLRAVSNEMSFIHFVKINITQNPEIAKRYNIVGVPTFQYFHNGKLVHKNSGGMDTAHIHKELAEMLYK